MKIIGNCLCGALEYEIDTLDGEIYQCHCSICRRATGSASNANLIVQAEKFKWLKEPSTLHHYCVTEKWSSSFCRDCGSKAPCENSEEQIYYVPAGTLNEDHGLKVTSHVFVGSKAHWDIIGGPAKQQLEM